MNLFNPGLGKNDTFVRPAYFIISGFSGVPNIKYYYAFLCLLYIVSVLGNTAVMALIYLDCNLRTPKYIIVFNLAFTDFFSSCALVPKILDIFLFDHRRISYQDCLAFLFFCYACLNMQAFNLVALSWDRLVAITHPLHYHMVVTNRSVFLLTASFWVADVLIMLVVVGLLTRLSFCRSLVINSYFCDHGQIFRLACNDNTPSLVLSFLLPALILWLPLVLILATYFHIGITLAKVASSQERLKAIKTCTSHISLVAIFFLPIIITFTMSAKIHPNARILNLSLASTLPSMLNPIIYVLQTQEIKESLKKLLKNKGHCNVAIRKTNNMK